MLTKFSIALLVLGIVTYGVYSFTSKPDFDHLADLDQTTLQGKLQSAQVYPKQAFTNNALQVRIDGATRDEYSYMEVRWLRNGQPIGKEATPTLPARHTKKGDKVQALVNLLGPDALPAPVATVPVKIMNSPPVINSISTDLRSMDGGDILVLKIDATDADNDPLRFTYKWFRNGQQIPQENKGTLKLTEAAAGDKYYATVVAFDGEDETAPYECEPVDIGGDAPMIVSQPPSSFTEDRRYVYQLEVEGRTEGLKFELVTAPEGMSISEGGAITWGLPEAEVGSREYKVAVKVSGTGGEATQEFSINLTGHAAN